MEVLKHLPASTQIEILEILAQKAVNDGESHWAEILRVTIEVLATAETVNSEVCLNPTMTS